MLILLDKQRYFGGAQRRFSIMTISLLFFIIQCAKKKSQKYMQHVENIGLSGVIAESPI